MKTQAFVSLLLSLATLAALTTGCSSPNPYDEYRETLAQAETRIDAGDPATAAPRLERFLAETRPDASDYALQRFFAAYLLTRAHEEAAYEDPFLTEPTGLGAGERSPSRVAHRVAVTYYAGFGLSWYEAALGAPAREEGVLLIPAGLEELGATDARRHLDLALLATYQQLDFEANAERVLLGMEDVLELERCDEVMRSARVPEAAQPWIYCAVFDYLRQHDEPQAYRFGIRARETAELSRGTFDEERYDAIAEWILHGSRYEFRSPANQLYDPELPGCTVTGTPNIEFEAVMREAESVRP